MLRLRFVCLLICCAGLVALAACGATPASAPTTVPGGVGTTTSPAASLAASSSQPTAIPANTPAARGTASVASMPGTRVAAATSSARTTTSVATPAARPQLPATVHDLNGRTVVISDVSRIVVLTGDIAEVVWALGLGAQVVATDTSATYPEAAKQAPKIGYMRTLSAEGILAQRPTVVIGGESAGPPAVLEQLRGAGVPVVIVATPSTLTAPAQKIREVAAALGVPDVGERLATQIQQEIAAAQALAAQAKSKPRVVFLNLRGNQVQQISGRGTPAQAVIEGAGGIDAGAAAGVSGYQPLTAEGLVAAQPDYILVFSLGLASIGGTDQLLQLPGVSQTPAGQGRKVLSYDDQYLLGLGPRTGQMLDELVRALHPEVR